MEEVHGITQGHLVFLDGYQVNRRISDDFVRLQDAASSAGIDLKIASGFRSFERQLSIWNGKARGERTLLNREGKELGADATDEECLDAMLCWSSPPGLSRHHWGTDLDVYDGSALPTREDLRLVPEEYSETGVFAKLTAFLDHHIVENKSFGFYRPYAQSSGGVAGELWHLSHHPVADDYFSLLSKEVVLAFLREHRETIAYSDIMLKKIDTLFDRYIVNISPPPWV